MNKLIVFVTIVAGVALCNAAPAPQNDGRRYDYRDYAGQQQGYTDAAGVYHHMPQPYMHVHDNRELGKYVHIPNPYDGGYGPYSGSNLPYVHDAKPYVHDVKPYDHSLYTTTTTKKPTTTTKRTTTTTTTTTTTPRSIIFNYDDEGRHKILHQEDARKHDKYDHAYLTENGIYGEEQAKLHHTGGTHAQGYYEYTGDDGKLYRVNYKSTHEGFVPEGDHIPTPPPIPAAIARALKYVDDKRKENGEKPLFDERGFRIDHMSKDMVKSIKSIHIENMPQDIAEQIHELQLEMEAIYGPNEERAEEEVVEENFNDGANYDEHNYEAAAEENYK
ncbi:uncharacterized protein LOC111688680 isoform X4 [Lucilia cuprina]|uniref:uncharacterized protein LOC111688680 isoform X4 n=1 Tax=Lucilia cuprina TaxID=7375 RepID=UPI001F06322B|nr:uncharacterized protein LOC111688680 isoform X4 [Lucilia cuprina]